MQRVVKPGTLIAPSFTGHCRHQRSQPLVKKHHVGPVSAWYLVKSIGTFGCVGFSVPGAYRYWCNWPTNSDEDTPGESATVSSNATCCGNAVAADRLMPPIKCRRSLVLFLAVRAWSCPRARQPLCPVLIAPPSTIGGGVGRQADPASILLPAVRIFT